MKHFIRSLLFGTLLIAIAAPTLASTDYAPAIWRPAYSGHWYTSGNGHKFCVCHDMEGYYLSTISYMQRSTTQVSAHYCVNGLTDSSDNGAAPGEVSQCVRESYYAWHALCWNTHSFGTEHEGFVSNPAWFTEAMYQATADLHRHLCDAWSIPTDRNHIVGHDEKKNAAWCTYAEANLGIDAHCNTHTDPGANWNWTHLMALINAQNPPYTFGANVQGWYAGHSTTTLNWNGSSWPGCLYTDQNGDDGYIYSPSTSYTGPGAPVINVSLYPQSGTTANHDMQVFFKTAADNTWTASKSSPVESYVAQNGWIRLNLDLSAAGYAGQVISQLRLDFDQANSGTRWIVNHVVSQSSLRWRFDANVMGWTPGNGVSPLVWTDCCGWPGCLYFDQTANDGYIYANADYFSDSGPYKFLGGAKDKIHVRLYPQNGSTASHDMAVYFITSNDSAWDEAKSVHTTYTGQNAWVDVYLDMGSNATWRSADNSAGGIANIRLDVDQTNQGTRFIIDSILFEH